MRTMNLLSGHRALPMHVSLTGAAAPHLRIVRRRIRPLTASPLSPIRPCHTKDGCSLRTYATRDVSVYQPTSAKDAIEEGLKQFNEQKNYAEAARLFNAALDMKASDDEKCAALYNLGCAYTKLKQWKPAADSIVRAINDHKLKISVALNDDDLRALRDRREWIDALTEVKGGLSREMKNELRSEARAPFRFPRFIILGGLLMGASIGLFIITARLIRAIKGGDGAPDLTETVQNFGINATAVAILGGVLIRDYQQKQKALRVTEREEMLSRLQLDLGNGRVLPLIKFRGQVRFVILAGTRSFVEKAIKDAEAVYLALRERGVSVVPLILSDRPGDREDDPAAKLRALKRELQKKDTSKGFGNVKVEKPDTSAQDSVTGTVTEEDKKWRLTAYDPAEWEDWVEEQKTFSKLGSQRNCYMQVQLDGTVRTSGIGAPNWAKLVDDLPELTSVRTTFTDGIGPSI